MKLLIAEDNVLMRRLIKSLVGSLAATIDECSNGREALALYEEKRHDCVLMDIEMAEMDGLTATKLIIAAHPQARVVIITQFKDEYLSNAARDAGAFAFVAKENLAAVREVVRREKRKG